MNTQTQSKVNGDLLLLLFLSALGFMCLIGYTIASSAESLATWIGSNSTFTDPAAALALSTTCIFVMILCIVSATVFGFRKAAQRRRQSEFLSANPSLSGDAIRKTVKYLKQRTTYTNVRFGSVGIAVAREFHSNVHPVLPGDIFAFEALRTYLHFMDQKYPLPKSTRAR